jgi:hypothetical protein
MGNTDLVALAILSSYPSGTRCNNARAELFRSGQTDANIITAMNRLQIGSDKVHPYNSINIDEMITPTDPSVSASMWRNIPCMSGLS